MNGQPVSVAHCAPARARPGTDPGTSARRATADPGRLMDAAIVLFTRDLRVHDNPALADACARARRVVPLFVVDPALTVPPNRARSSPSRWRCCVNSCASAAATW